MTTKNTNKTTETAINRHMNLSLQALVAAALVLPGLVQHTAQAADDDEVDFQYSHYQEGKRDIYGTIYSPPIFAQGAIKIPQNLNPIEVDSVHGSARITLTDRVKFAFNYLQDTWSGATPIGTAPAIANGNNGGVNTVTGPSPFVGYGAAFGNFFIDKDKHFYQAVPDFNTGIPKPGLRDDRLTHVLSYASPETRKQGDFKLSYQWDKAALDIGGGISVENDYESRFGNVGGHFDFNQKQTTVNWGISYTNSDTNATLDPDGLPFFNTQLYDNSIAELVSVPNGLTIVKAIPIQPQTPSGYVDSSWSFDPTTSSINRTAVLRGNRQDWGTQLGLSQVLGKNSLVSLDLGYTRSTGYLSNPYKIVLGHTTTLTQGNDKPGPLR